MARGPLLWNVWYWDGESFQLVWHDLTKADALDMTEWRNHRFVDEGEGIRRYVIAGSDEEPTLA